MGKEHKEKSVELFNKFIRHSKGQTDEARKIHAKQCALIAVEEILKTTPMYTGNLNPKWKYWGEVKQEIEKL